MEKNGGITLKPAKRGGGFHLKTFDEILSDPITKQVMEENLVNYFRILFTDPRGWNLRNKVCHGIMAPEMFNKQTADRIFHALICLGFSISKSTNI